MPSWVAIANLALTHLGTERITALTDAGAAARAVAATYELVRDAVLREHPWNCALARTRLAAELEAPAFGFAFRYTLPADPYCLRVLALGEGSAAWALEGRHLLTDHAPPLPVRYIARVSDPALFDAALVPALAARLAHAIAYAIVQSREAEAAMWTLYQQLLRTARSLDGKEGPPQQRLSGFVAARY